MPPPSAFLLSIAVCAIAALAAPANAQVAPSPASLYSAPSVRSDALGSSLGRATFAPDGATADQQIPQGPRSPFTPPPPFRLGFRAFGSVDWITMTATDTFSSVVGDDQLDALGAGVEVTGVGRGAFARFAFSRATAEGTRGFVFQDEFIPLNIPTRVELWPIEIGGGWRQSLGRSGRVAVYGGAAYVLLLYKNESDFAADDENVDEQFNGWSFFGGADVDLYKGLMVGGEVQYRIVPDAAGENDILRQFGEDDLGGLVIRVLIGYRR